MKCFYCLGQGCHLCHNSGKRVLHENLYTNERYTPKWLVDASRATMGSIDLDPCSCTIAQNTVRAEHYYTWKDNGLKQRWYGNIFCNPPYGRVPGKIVGLQVLFVEKGVEAHERGEVDQIVYVLNGNAPYRP